MPVPGPPLPIDDVLADVVGAARAGAPVVLQAPPGAGKTTRVPLALLEALRPGEGRVVVLEPRRVAARAAARHMARLLGERVGRTVGYVTRDERVVSERTRVEVVTEGVLVRRVQRDPGLPGVAAVLFDEFHERSLHADLGLALCLEVREALRPDLRLLVMSATLEGRRVAALVEDAVEVTSEGRAHPVDVRYRDRPLADRVEPHVVAAVVDALGATDGDVLVFLPGAGEIRRVQRDLEGRVGPGVVLAPLYGALPPREQDRAIDPAPPGTRKVVLATDIAETSLTIEGVRTVVDGGLTREPRLDPATGMSRLVTVRVSRASADQRCGRAGRVAPGTCLRLWSERDHAALDTHRRPEIAQADLAGFALELAQWGVTDPSELRLLDAPPERSWHQAVELLRRLDALDGDGRITDHGRALADLPVHPRLAHVVVRGRDQGRGPLACDVAALLADRDVLATDRDTTVTDLTARLRVLHGEAPPTGARVRRGALRRARKEADRLRRLAGVTGQAVDADAAGGLLALAYPDRVAGRRGDRRGAFLLSNGRGATLPEGDVLAGEDLLVVADVDAGRGEARIHLAAPVDRDTLVAVLDDHLDERDVVTWDDAAGDVVAERQVATGALVLERRALDPPPDGATTVALLEGVRRAGLELLAWTRAARDLQARVGFLRRHLGDDWPDLSDERLLATLEEWLGPFLAGRHRRAHLAGVPLEDALRARLRGRQLQQLDELAPTHLQVPSGSRIRLDYRGEDGPILAVKLQELFGATDTPRVAAGRVPVTIHLLSPARRPVQVTRDLAGFWERHYADVRAELRGRYPKHPWPSDPLAATPTARTKRA